MEGVISSIISIGSQYFVKRLDTGDKLFDTSVISIFTTIFALSIHYIWKKISDINTYNKIIYAYYFYIHKQHDPLVLKTESYKYNMTEIKTYKSMYVENSSTHIQRFVEKLLTKYPRSILIVDQGPFYCDGQTVYTNITNGIPSIPIYFDGEDMMFATLGSKNRISYLWAKDSMKLSKLYSYLNIRTQEENKEQQLSEQDSISLYEYSSSNVTNKVTYSNPASQKLETIFTYKSKISFQKQFQYIFYDQKDKLVSMLERFQNGRLYPPQITMDNKLGILLYGPPGTGKTGTISAIANMLQRSILVINFAKITKKSDLDYVLKDCFYDKLIYVFDEFDCVLDVLIHQKDNIKKDTTKDEQTSMKMIEMLKVTDGEDKKQILDMMFDDIEANKKDDKLDMAYLLQKLDGIECANNRIIIATTNRPELINPVLLRPGRFDIKLELGNCSQQMYIDILTSFFQLDEQGVNSIKNANLPIKKWSPLQVINQALICNDLNKTLNVLKQ